MTVHEDLKVARGTEMLAVDLRSGPTSHGTVCARATEAQSLFLDLNATYGFKNSWKNERLRKA